MAELTVLGALRGALTRQKALNPVPSGGAWRTILESFAGAWQKGVTEKRGDLVTYPTLYACIYRIASDIGKLPFTLKRLEKSGVWAVTDNAAYSPVLRSPNHFQTPSQFREQWILSKLTQGNAYILKSRDGRGVVTQLYVLDPERVLPMVSDAGEVYYQVQSEKLSTLPAGYPADSLVIPASEIIHDRCMTLHHPLVGVPPLAAAYWPALKNMKIMRSATDFFANNAQPGGILTGPAGMTEKDAQTLSRFWDENFTGPNAGKIAVIGSDVKFTSFSMKSIDAQMVEQLRYSDEQICQPFGMPPFKVGIGQIPAGLGVDGINQLYYSDALQPHIEHMEGLLDDGLAISRPLGVELDLDPLIRMDEGKKAEVEVKLVGGKIKTPDEGRARFNLAPTGGGGTLWGQNQDYPLGMLENRTEWDPKMQPPPAPPAQDKAVIDEMYAFIATQKAITAMKNRWESTDAI